MVWEKAVKEREQFFGLQIRPTASLFKEAEAKEPGEDNWCGYGFDIHPHVTVSAVFFLAIFIILSLMFQAQAGEICDSALAWISGTFGWFFIAGAGIMKTSEQVLEKYDLDFKLLASSGPAMTASLKDAIRRKKWIVVTGWRPHWMFGRWDLRFLEQDPDKTVWKEGNIHIIHVSIHS